MTTALKQSLVLPCGAVIANRVAKSAMSEGLATAYGVPTPALENLYGLWSEGGSGLLVTGNIMVDSTHRERMGNVTIDGPPSEALFSALARWAESGTRNGNHFWAQINHPGRQVSMPMNPAPKGPSAVKLNMPEGMFGDPQELTTAEITEIVAKFANAALTAKQAGFTGVEVHCAHGFLLSQFLSPISNHRNDQFGGDLANRARFPLMVVEAVRREVGAQFPVAVKLNSADFLKGGFSFEECVQVAKWLEAAGIDLVEVSGGSYESLALLGERKEDEPIDRGETAVDVGAYFGGFAKSIREQLSIPVMVTGGVRSAGAMEKLIVDGVADLVGIGRPMCVLPDAASRVLDREEDLPAFEDAHREVGALPTLRWFNCRMQELAHEGRADITESVEISLSKYMEREDRMRREKLEQDSRIAEQG